MTCPGGSNSYVPSLGNEKKKRYGDDKFVTHNHVSIFDEHSGDEENLDIEFTPEVLGQIVSQNNDRINDGAGCPIIVDGHTNEDGEPEEDCIVGWADNFSVDEFGKDKKAIYCDMHFTKERYNEVKSLAAGMDLPRRSVELWQDNVVDPIRLKAFEKPVLDVIALLGKTRPARSLPQSNEKYFEKNKSKSKYQYELKGESTMDEQTLKQILESVMQLPCMRWCDEQMQKAQLAAEQPDEAAPALEDKKPDDKKEVFADDEEEDKDKKEVFTDEEKKPDEDEEKSQMAHNQMKRKYSRLESEHKALFAKVAELERKERVATRTNALLQLEAEGYQFSMADEVADYKDCSNEVFTKHIKSIKANYKKAPLGVELKPVGIPDGGIDPTPIKLSPHDVTAQAVAKARELYSKKGA